MELKQYYEAITDIWRLFKEFVQRPVDGDYWTEFILSCGDIDNRYQKNAFVHKTLLALADELETVKKSESLVWDMKRRAKE